MIVISDPDGYRDGFSISDFCGAGLKKHRTERFIFLSLCKNNIAISKQVPYHLKPFLCLPILLSNNEGY